MNEAERDKFKTHEERKPSSDLLSLGSKSFLLEPGGVSRESFVRVVSDHLRARGRRKAVSERRSGCEEAATVRGKRPLTENLFQNLVERSSPLSLPRINTLSSILAFAFSLGDSFSLGAQAKAGEGRAPLKGDPPWKGDDDDDA